MEIIYPTNHKGYYHVQLSLLASYFAKPDSANKCGNL